jgi:predicted O-methyltransferase YrrM
MTQKSNNKEDEYTYRPMNEENKAFMEYAIEMYKGQEIDERFSEKNNITINLPGGLNNFIIEKYVYSPEHVNVAMAWPEFIAQRSEGKSFLEIGTGTGICAIYVALNGKPSKVVATDISPLAVENCKKNALQYDLKEPSFLVCEGNVYDALKNKDEKFDIMFWNFPWNAPDKSIEEILLERGEKITSQKIHQLQGGLDPLYKGLRYFIRDGQKYLNPGGEILLGASEVVRYDIIRGEVEKYGYNIEVVNEKPMVIDKIGNKTLKVILYRLTQK